MPDAACLLGATRIVVLRALQLGDLLCSVPAFRALRRGAPGAHVALIGLPWAQTFVDRFSAYLDELIVFPGYPGMPERDFVPAELPPFLLEMQRRGFDLALQMQGNGFLSNGLVAQLGARRSAGFYLPGTWRPDETYIPYPTHLPEVERHLALMGHLGADGDDGRMEFPVVDADRDELARVTGPLRRGSYVCLHPGARDPQRRWPAERFAAVADRLTREGLAVVVTGSAEEAELTAAVRRVMRTPAIELAGQLSLGALAALLADAALLVSNDTGTSHLAAAVGTPSVVIFSASDPDRWGPADRVRHRVLGGPAEDWSARHCCLGEVCSLGVDEWLPVTPADVAAEALELLSPSHTDAAGPLSARHTDAA